jgi:hypothetical protein
LGEALEKTLGPLLISPEIMLADAPGSNNGLASEMPVAPGSQHLVQDSANAQMVRREGATHLPIQVGLCHEGRRQSWSSLRKVRTADPRSQWEVGRPGTSVQSGEQNLLAADCFARDVSGKADEPISVWVLFVTKQMVPQIQNDRESADHAGAHAEAALSRTPLKTLRDQWLDVQMSAQLIYFRKKACRIGSSESWPKRLENSRKAVGGIVDQIVRARVGITLGPVGAFVADWKIHRSTGTKFDSVGALVGSTSSQTEAALNCWRAKVGAIDNSWWFSDKHAPPMCQQCTPAMYAAIATPAAPAFDVTPTSENAAAAQLLVGLLNTVLMNKVLLVVNEESFGIVCYQTTTLI